MGTIPLLDIEPFLKGDQADKIAVGKAVDKACSEIGFLIIKGHGVNSALISDMYRVSESYFARPLWEKMRYKMPVDRYRGYTSFGSEGLAYSLDDVTPPDLKESFSMGPFNHSYDEYHFGEDGGRFFAPNVWPNQPEEMQRIWENYYSEMERLARDLMRIFAIGLDLDATWFDNKIDRHVTNFSAIHYPGQNNLSVRDGQLRAGSHSDYGSLTIVQTNTDVGGLEVQSGKGKWEAVPWLPDTFVVNIGDLMAEWTNDRWVSTLHRVVNPPESQQEIAKTSMLFFHQPNYDAKIECIPTCVSSDNPAKYGKTTSGEHVTMKITKHRMEVE